jgi:hypothetical protein
VNDSGFILISREMLDHPVFANEPYCERLAWVWLIREAAWKDRVVRVGRAVISLRRGECAVSTRFVADRWQWSESRVRRYLGRLSKQGLIDTKSDAHATQITICNYDKYQLPTQAGDAGPTQDRRTSDANKNELNTGNTGNIEKETPTGVSKKRGSRLSEDWQLPDDWRQDAADRGLSAGKITTEAEKFRNHFIGQPGQRGVRADWRSTWRNWAINAATDFGRKAANQPGPGRDANGDLNNDFLFGGGRGR